MVLRDTSIRMPDHSQNRPPLHEIDDHIVECPECRKTVPEEDYDLSNRCLECGTHLQRSPVLSQLELRDLVVITGGWFEGMKGQSGYLTHELTWWNSHSIPRQCSDRSKCG